MDDVISLNIYKLGIKDTTDTASADSCLDLHLEIDSQKRLRTKLYDKRNDLNFPIVIFPFLCSHISTTHAEVVVPILISLVEGCS